MTAEKAQTEKTAKGVKPVFNLAGRETRVAQERGEWMSLKEEGSSRRTGVEFLVYGTDSKQVRASRNKVAQRLQVNQRRGRNRKLSLDEIEEGDIIVAVGAMGDWRTKMDDGTWKHEIYWGDDTLEFNEKNLRMLFEEWPDMAVQVLEFVDDRANFSRS